MSAPFIVLRDCFKEELEARNRRFSGTVDKEVRTISNPSLSSFFMISNNNFIMQEYAAELLHCLDARGSEDEAELYRRVCLEALSVSQPLVSCRGNEGSDDLRGRFRANWALPRNAPITARAKRTSKLDQNDKPGDGRPVKILGTSRNISSCLDGLLTHYRGTKGFNDDRAAKLASEIKDELNLYESMRAICESTGGPEPHVFYKLLLPVWLMRQLTRDFYGATNLFRFFEAFDEHSLKTFVERTAERLCEAFVTDNSIDEDMKSTVILEEYRKEAEALSEGIVRSQHGFVECDCYFHWVGSPVRGIYRALYGNDLGAPWDLYYEQIPSRCPEFPEHLLNLAKLIWHFVGGAIYGPVITLQRKPTMPDDDPEERRFPWGPIVGGSGDVIIRAISETGQASFKKSIPFGFDLDKASRSDWPDEGLVLVLERSFIPQYFPSDRIRNAVNSNLFSLLEASMSKATHIETGSFCDSDWHVGGFVRGNDRHLELVDLGSIMGTFVVRGYRLGPSRGSIPGFPWEGAEESEAFILEGREGEGSRSASKIEAVLLSRGIDGDRIHLVESVEIHRGDLVFLGDSVLEII